jgi:hypothetical protein
MSPQARTFFKSSCVQVGIKPLELVLWIRTRWASLYKFIDRLLNLRKVSRGSQLSLTFSDNRQGVDQFVLLADASEKVPPLPKDRSYADFQLTKKDWDRLSVIHEVLRVRVHLFSHVRHVSHHLPHLLYQEPSNVQQTFSNERTPTVWRIIPALEFLIKRWESMVEQHRFRDVKDAITQGVNNLQKWYRKVDNTSSAYFICLGASPHACCLTQLTFLEVLDPNVKDLYCRHRWEPDQYAAGMASLEATFDEYYIPLQAPSASTCLQQGKRPLTLLNPLIE